MKLLLPPEDRVVATSCSPCSATWPSTKHSSPKPP